MFNLSKFQSPCGEMGLKVLSKDGEYFLRGFQSPCGEMGLKGVFEFRG